MLNPTHSLTLAASHIYVKQWCLSAGDIYAVGTSDDSAVVVSMVEPRPYRIVNAWKIYNVTVTISAFQWIYLLGLMRLCVQ